MALLFSEGYSWSTIARNLLDITCCFTDNSISCFTSTTFYSSLVRKVYRFLSSNRSRLGTISLKSLRLLQIYCLQLRHITWISSWFWNIFSRLFGLIPKTLLRCMISSSIAIWQDTTYRWISLLRQDLSLLLEPLSLISVRINMILATLNQQVTMPIHLNMPWLHLLSNLPQELRAQLGGRALDTSPLFLFPY